MKYYYKLDEDGNILESYAKNQPHIDGLVKLDESPSLNYQWDGTEWVYNFSEYKEQKKQKAKEIIKNDFMDFQCIMTSDNIRNLYCNFVADLETATTINEVDILYNTMYQSLYPG